MPVRWIFRAADHTVNLAKQEIFNVIDPGMMWGSVMFRLASDISFS
jgi:hypothetical protein